MSKRSVLGLIFSLETMQKEGVDLSILEKRYGLKPERLSLQGEVEQSVVLRMFSDLMPYIDDPMLATKIGCGTGIAGYGQLIPMLLTCSNTLEAYKCGLQFQEMTYLYGRIGVRMGQTETAVTFTPMNLPENCRRFMFDRDVSGIYQFISEVQSIMGVPDYRANLMRMPYPRPAHAKALEERFDCPIEYDTDVAETLIPNEYLSLPMPSANKAAHKLYRQECEQILARLLSASDDGLKQQVFDYLNMFVNSFPTMNEVASAFSMTERTFRRKLGDEDCTYRDILDEVRFTRAKDLLLTTSKSIEKIAIQMGYTQASSFIHSFQRWTGATPTDFRAQKGLIS